tara:strand:+ start:343 stop:726 length:384 start_codon:yes stop_codon:yes gene_type:complete
MTISVGKCLAEFHIAFGCTRNQSFETNTIEATELLLLKKRLINEEINEVFEAIKENNDTHVLKELVDLVVVCVGMADTYGWDFDNAFKRVHESNMSKLDDEGRPIYREDGKVLKSKNYKAPYLTDLV